MSINSYFKDIPEFFKEYVRNPKLEEQSFNLDKIYKMVSSPEFKFWVRTGISTCGLIVSFYAMYRLFQQLTDMKGKSKEDAKSSGERILKKLGLDISKKLTEHELYMCSNIIDCDSLNTEWDDIGGLDSIIDEIKMSVLSPILGSYSAISSKLYNPPKGLLLFGPSGCGKTMIVRTMAKYANCRFLNLQTSSIMDMYVGESEKHVEAIFTLAAKIQPVIIFIDEIDGLLSCRTNSCNQETFLSIKTMFMSLWDGVLTDENSKIIIVGASNRPNSIDKAILRRLPVQIEIRLPDLSQRRSIFRVILKNEAKSDSITDDTLNYLSLHSEGLSGSAIKDVCRDAVITAIYNFNTGRSDNFLLEDTHLYCSLTKFKTKIESLRHY